MAKRGAQTAYSNDNRCDEENLEPPSPPAVQLQSGPSYPQHENCSLNPKLAPPVRFYIPTAPSLDHMGVPKYKKEVPVGVDKETKENVEESESS